MKNNLLILFALIFGTTINAQDWNTAGNTVAGGAVLGTNNNQSLIIISNATERYRITPFGSFQWFSSNATGLRSMALGNNTTAAGENSFSGGVKF